MFIKRMSEQLVNDLAREGFTNPTEFQEMFLKKINSGQNIIGIAPENSGRTMALLISSLHKLEKAFEQAPRVVIVLDNDERVKEFETAFMNISRYTDLRIDAVTDAGIIKDQIDWIFEGTDIVVGTARRLHAIYLQNGLNVNKLLMFAIDDAETQLRNKRSKELARLLDGLPRCQKLIITDDFSARLENLLDEYVPALEIVE